MRCAKLFACGVALILGIGIGFDARAGGDRGAASGELIEVPLLFALPDDGHVVFLAASQVGATEARFRGHVVVVPVAGDTMTIRGPFAVPSGTDRLTITMGERVVLGRFDSPFFVTAVFVPRSGSEIPYVVAAPKWVSFLHRDKTRTPDQEDSPGLTHAGGFRVLAGRSGDDTDSAAQVNRRRGRRGL